MRKNSRMDVIALSSVILLTLFMASSINARASHLGDILVKNPSFEGGWNATSNSPNNWSTPDARWYGSLDFDSYNGNYSYKLTTTNLHEGWSWVRNEVIKVEQNKTYFIRTHLKYQNVKGSHIVLEGNDSKRNEWYQVMQIPSGLDGSSGWREYTTFWTPPEDVSEVRFALNAGWVFDEKQGNATTWFDDIEILEPAIVNSVKYEKEVKLGRGEAWKWGDFALYLSDVYKDRAFFNLVYNGSKIDSAIIEAGNDACFSINSDKVVVFKLKDVFYAGNYSQVWLEEIMAGNVEVNASKLKMKIEAPSTAYVNGNLSIKVIIGNEGEGYSERARLEVLIGDKKASKDLELELNKNEEKQFTFNFSAPASPGDYEIKVVLKSSYREITSTAKIRIKTLNPDVKSFIADLKMSKNIEGYLEITSNYDAKFVEYKLPVNISVYKLNASGLEKTYGEKYEVSGRENIAIARNNFYAGDGWYIVKLELAGMERTFFFEVGKAAKNLNQNQKVVIPIEVYSPLLLLMGMFGVLTIRNHLYREREVKSLPVEWIAMISGIALILSSPFIGKLLIEGLYITLAGLFLLILNKNDARAKQLLSRNSTLHDYASLLIVFFASFILLQNFNSYLLILLILLLYTLAISIWGRT